LKGRINPAAHEGSGENIYIVTFTEEKSMNRKDDLYIAQSEKSVAQFVADFAEIVKKNEFVVNNYDTMDMKSTFREHGGEVPDEFDLHMMQVCKPTKADKSLTMNPERAILMPKFVMVFSKEGKTQIRYLSYSYADIEDLVPNDPKFPENVSQTFVKIRSMIDEVL
jgi:uncharacterized protein (DUF302 family)